MDDGQADVAGNTATSEDALSSTSPEEIADAGGGDKPPREPLALETALTWLAKIKPAAVLALLRDPDLAFVSMTAFVGFRVNGSGYANPLVRRRLAQEAVRDEKFADKLRDLAEKAPPLPVVQEEPSDQPVPPAERPPLPVSTDRQQVLRSERDRRRRERDEARQALAASQAARQEAERLRQQAESERDEANQQGNRQAQRIARLERQVMKLQVEQTSLLRALRQQDTSPGTDARRDTPRPPAATQPALPHPVDLRENLWQTAVTHLLDKRRYDQALDLAADVLRADPDNTGALDIAARAQGAKGKTREAAALLRRRLTVLLDQGERGESGDVLLRLLLLAPAEHERDLRSYLSSLRAYDAPALEQARAFFARLRGIAPETYATVASAVGRLAPPGLVAALMPPPGQIGPEDPLPLGLGGSLSARQLLRAVDTGHVDLVESARAALRRLGQTGAADQERVQQALERAGSGDSTYLVPLLGARQRGPVVVDGSNAAWFDQESLAAGRPRLQSLLGLRRALRARGYFPVQLHADAPLPYTIDEPDTLRAMVALGELSLVDSGVDADEVLLREAKRLGAPLVTNDYMTDWDPNNEVPKIRFTLSLDGEAYLLDE